MPVKCKSEQITTEQYVYTMGEGVHEFWPVKARRNEVLVCHKVCVFNPGAVTTGRIWKVMKRRGKIFYLNTVATLATGLVQRWAVDVYLIDGDEMGLIVTAEQGGAEIEYVCQCLRWRDDEYDKST